MIAPYFFLSLNRDDLDDLKRCEKILASFELAPQLRSVKKIHHHWIYCLFPQNQIIDEHPDQITIGLGQYKRKEGPWAIVQIDLKDESLTIERDPLGLLPLFLDHKGTRVATEHFELVRYCGLSSLDHSAMMDFICWGQTFGEQTLFKDLKLLTQYSFLKKNSHQLHMDIKSIPKKTQLRKSIYTHYTESIQSLLETLKPQYFTLTGGSDSRFNLYSLSKSKQKELLYWFDTSVFTHATDLNCELAAIHPIVDELNLKLIYNYPDLENDPHIHLEHRYCDKDANAKSVTGLYGTEWMSGAFLNRFYQSGPLSFDMGFYLKNYISSQDYARYHNILESNKSFFYQYNNQSSDARLEQMLQSQRSFVTDYYQSALWVHPWLQTHRKPTPYLSAPLLEELSHQSLDQIQNYSLFIKLFKDHYPEALKKPLHSTMNFHLENPLWAKEFILKKYETLNSSPPLLKSTFQPRQDLGEYLDLINSVHHHLEDRMKKVILWRGEIIQQVCQS